VGVLMPLKAALTRLGVQAASQSAGVGVGRSTQSPAVWSQRSETFLMSVPVTVATVGRQSSSVRQTLPATFGAYSRQISRPSPVPEVSSRGLSHPFAHIETTACGQSPVQSLHAMGVFRHRVTIPSTQVNAPKQS
jgi:hypothetical protein